MSENWNWALECLASGTAVYREILEENPADGEASRTPAYVDVSFLGNGNPAKEDDTVYEVDGTRFTLYCCDIVGDPVDYELTDADRAATDWMAG
jgi:hypothetical protein